MSLESLSLAGKAAVVTGAEYTVDDGMTAQ